MKAVRILIITTLQVLHEPGGGEEVSNLLCLVLYLTGAVGKPVNISYINLACCSSLFNLGLWPKPNSYALPLRLTGTAWLDEQHSITLELYFIMLDSSTCFKR